MVLSTIEAMPRISSTACVESPICGGYRTVPDNINESANDFRSAEQLEQYDHLRSISSVCRRLRDMCVAGIFCLLIDFRCVHDFRAITQLVNEF